ncbi:hypothetical protein D3C78_311490 [compost metagenome]
MAGHVAHRVEGTTRVLQYQAGQAATDTACSQRLAVEQQLPVGAVKAWRQQVEHTQATEGFARATGTDQRADFAAAQLQVNAVHQHAGLSLDAQAADFKY